jgi:hypothetical protein
MAIKYTCDFCDKEIIDKPKGNRFEQPSQRFVFTMASYPASQTAEQAHAHTFDTCSSCLRKRRQNAEEALFVNRVENNAAAQEPLPE